MSGGSELFPGYDAAQPAPNPPSSRYQLHSQKCLWMGLYIYSVSEREFLVERITVVSNMPPCGLDMDYEIRLYVMASFGTDKGLLSKSTVQTRQWRVFGA